MIFTGSARRPKNLYRFSKDVGGKMRFRHRKSQVIYYNIIYIDKIEKQLIYL